jgi:SAM-dependent methyltransferase
MSGTRPRETSDGMHPGEHRIMAHVEATHWWYRGLRDAVIRTLARRSIPPGGKVLDAGCGTGANLAALGRALQPSYLGGFDVSPEALELAREKVPGADLYRSDICDPELHDTGFDVIVSLDVIYIPGTQKAFAGLERLVESLRPGGLLLLNLPAYDWLFSEHDVAIHTTERYTAGRVRDLLERLTLRVELLTYRLCFLFPAVVLSRLPGKLRGARAGDATARSDLHRPPGPIVNAAFDGAMRFENRLISAGVRFPWGSSVFAIGTRP